MNRQHLLKVVIFLAALVCLASPVHAAKAKVDFNGDGRGDIFLQDIFSGSIASLFSTGGQPQTVSYVTVPPQTGWVPIALSDFNGDGRTDLMVRNTKTGQVSVWLIDGSAITQQGTLGTAAPSTGWAPLDVNDYDGDGRADLLWRNGSTGELVVWILNGTGVTQSGSLGTVGPSSGWMPIGFGDFNGDGAKDILWRHSSGALYLWLVHGTQTVPLGMLSVDSSSGWMPAAVNDFNGDGMADLLWRHSVTGAFCVWILRGNQIMQAASIGVPVGPDQPWAPIGLGDLNGDGTSDILWRNSVTGGIYVWLLNGVAVPYMAGVASVAPDSGWLPIGLDDYNNDGRSDILWRNAFSDDLYIWYMNGSVMVQGQALGKLPTSTVWQAQIPR